VDEGSEVTKLESITYFSSWPSLLSNSQSAIKE